MKISIWFEKFQPSLENLNWFKKKNKKKFKPQHIHVLHCSVYRLLTQTLSSNSRTEQSTGTRSTMKGCLEQRIAMPYVHQARPITPVLLIRYVASFLFILPVKGICTWAKLAHSARPAKSFALATPYPTPFCLCCYCAGIFQKSCLIH